VTIRSHIGLAAAITLMVACVPLPPELVPKGAAATASATSSFPDVEPSAISQSSLHFSIRGYSERDMAAIATLAENIYNKIGNDTGLYSFLAGQTFPLTLYKDQAEYQEKTKQPAWSRAIQAGGRLYTYPSPEAGPTLAHQMSHLIFNAYMGDRAKAFNWLNEGLAMVQEVGQMPDYERVVYRTTQNNKLRTDRQSFSQMTFFVGNDEERRRQDAWYLQVESVVEYLMRQGTTLTFAAFLNQLRNGAEFNQALADVYSAKFRGIGDLELAWQANR
jgi:hypothetical protein